MGWWRKLMDAFEARFMPLSWLAKRVRFGFPKTPIKGAEGSENALREIKKD